MVDILKNGLKRNLNMRARKDSDLLMAVKQAGLDVQGMGDFSHFCRELMRDGLRFRHLLQSGKLSGDAFVPLPQLTAIGQEEDEAERLERKYGSIADSEMLEEGQVD